MLELKLGNNTYELATSLRVIYALKDIIGAKNLQEAIGSITKLTFDGQLDLIWAAYKAANNNVQKVKNEFIDEILDNLGVFAITNIVNELANGLLYNGLSQEEMASKKMEVEKAAAQIAGTPSFAKDTD